MNRAGALALLLTLVLVEHPLPLPHGACEWERFYPEVVSDTLQVVEEQRCGKVQICLRRYTLVGDQWVTGPRVCLSPRDRRER